MDSGTKRDKTTTSSVQSRFLRTVLWLGRSPLRAVRRARDVFTQARSSGLRELAVDASVMQTKPDDPRKLNSESQEYQKRYRRLRNSPYIPSDRPYHITICHEKKFIWFRVAKVGTRTIYHHLQDHMTLDVSHPYGVYYPPRLYSSYFKFAFVRNPWDRLISCWRDKVFNYDHFEFGPEERERMKTLENFVEFVANLDLATCDDHLRLQSRLIDLNHIDFIGRFERFEDDYRFVCQSLGIEMGDLEVRNKSERDSYYEYYSDELAARVAQIYQVDIRLFGYTYD